MEQPTSGPKLSCGNQPVLLTELKALEKHPTGEGFSHLGMDGVWREFDKDGKVWSYQTLSPEEIKEMVNVWPEDIRNFLEKELRGVDGRNVKDMAQLLHPDADIMPPVLQSAIVGHQQVTSASQKNSTS
ncbi:hypothetical protein LTR99_008744 [Exophiala xenobiotica]|uniref:Uncharacterized protein n=1 Tax=Vermiconidia calcicola TaxID=1690605 RepID=A0AAV9Q1L6_9PEZI|nr:hypothetical protein LTR47_009400 [Exophiala xenobiotica]KAK5533388.1 hypothetical protein LTR25_007254 [Vermiconidia calcicola]KAK5542850.1 hypothetical protein LTR23_005175 [Chaetothyriales sp. CCFEE 6169]KAK5243288.1 hypothetical protein LTS06_010908 [Exophiala xenobiotica]KAK5265607.1 hypothetical protein LTR96_009014 [Exophiala xenobiotica]